MFESIPGRLMSKLNRLTCSRHIFISGWFVECIYIMSEHIACNTTLISTYMQEGNTRNSEAACAVSHAICSDEQFSGPNSSHARPYAAGPHSPLFTCNARLVRVWSCIGAVRMEKVLCSDINRTLIQNSILKWSK